MEYYDYNEFLLSKSFGVFDVKMEYLYCIRCVSEALFLS